MDLIIALVSDQILDITAETTPHPFHELNFFATTPHLLILEVLGPQILVVVAVISQVVAEAEAAVALEEVQPQA